MKHARRLITSGCSCTQYCWPTWADYLGEHFAQYENVGLCGADNAVIARNVLEIVEPGDLVVVAWSSFDRFNSFEPSRLQESKKIGDRLVYKWSGLDSLAEGGWYHSGGRCGSKSFLVNHYHRIERFRHTLDYVKMLEMHSQIMGYELWNFSQCNLLMGETEPSIDPRLETMLASAKLDHFFLGKDLNTLRDEIAPITLRHKYSPNGDSHPTPWVNWIWLKDYVAPEIGIDLDLDLEHRVHSDQARVLAGDID